MQKVADGTYYLAGSSEALPVDLYLTSDNHLVIKLQQDDNEVGYVRFSDLSIQSCLGNMPREVSLPDKQALHINGNKEIDDWLYPKKSNRIHRLESSFRFALIAIITVPIALIGVFKFALPALAIHFAELVPDYVTDLSSKNTLAGLNRTVLDESELDEATQQKYITRWQGVVAKLPVKAQKFQFQFKKSDFFGANAFALPNGTIVVTDELVSLLEGQDNLLMAIILHEIGHVEHKHSMRLIAETLISSLAIDYLIGDVGGVIEVFAGASTTIIQNQFSQALEWEADDFSLTNIHHTGYSPTDFADAMSKLAEKGSGGNKLSALLSSHPMTQARIDNARTYQTKPTKDLSEGN